MTYTEEKIIKGSGNVFKDLGFENADEMLFNSNLVSKIELAIREKKLTQKAAGQLMGISQPKVCSLLKGNLDGFSTARLFRFLQALGQDVEVTIKPKSHEKAYIYLKEPPQIICEIAL